MLACLLAVTLVVRLAGLVSVRGVIVADVDQFYGVGDDIERGQSPYVVHRCNTPPVVVALSVLLRAVERQTGVTFDVLFKVPGIAADLAIVGLLFTTLLRTRGRAVASLAAAGYAVNPVSVIITSFHGQVDGVATLCCLAAVLLLERRQEPGFETLSALCLGAGIALKAWPVLLLPIVLVHLGGPLRRRLKYLILACLPAAAMLLPFFLDAPRAVFSSVMGYGGVTDHGWVAALRSFWFVRTGNWYLPGELGDTLNRWGKLVFVGLYVVLLSLGRRYWRLAGHCGAAFLLFYVTVGGLSSQYLVWLIPFALLGLEVMVVPYTLTATATLVLFYLRFFPEVLLGHRPHPEVSSVSLAVMHGSATAAWWLTCLVWLVMLFIRWSRPNGAAHVPGGDDGRAWEASSACRLSAAKPQTPASDPAVGDAPSSSIRPDDPAASVRDAGG